MQNRLIWYNLLPRNILSSGVFRRETASGFYPFDDATALAGEGGVRVVVWLIQASAWNQTCRSTNDRCEALASPKGCFLCFCFSPPSIYPLNLFVGQIAEKMSKIYLNVVGIFHIQNIFRKFVVEIMGAISRRFPSGASHSLSLIFNAEELHFII